MSEKPAKKEKGGKKAKKEASGPSSQYPTEVWSYDNTTTLITFSHHST
jgi:hypothetical protein